ncbi:42926_t:CDS:2, partial [Gigaspora margarita]
MYHQISLSDIGKDESVVHVVEYDVEELLVVVVVLVIISSGKVFGQEEK